MASGIQDLEWFARESLSRGLGKPGIRKAMLDAGWTEDQADNALGAYADVEFAVPVPKPRPQLSARDAFLYLVLFTTLYISSYNLGSLLFDLINKALPDATVRVFQSNGWDSMRWSASSLIVAFPTFLFLSYYIAIDLTRNPVKRLSPIRRWLTYLTLFVAACVLIGDVTALVYNALGGELTSRLALKVVTVGAIAGAVFGYYLTDLRHEERE
jgi:Domain of unknown function (DUF5671)